MATAWVLVLVTVVLGLARAGPVPTSKPTTTRRGCHIGRFQSLSPRELEAFKKAKDALEESLSLKNWNCSSRLFPRTRDPRHLQAWKRPVALEAEEAPRKESQGRLEASVTCNIFRLLTRDLTCVASGDLCLW
ncbi:Interferon Lambda-1 [Manis pentadactyla]|nr:Interferon Lambda-1 [Manis pentadactyla]